MRYALFEVHLNKQSTLVFKMVSYIPELVHPVIGWMNVDLCSGYIAVKFSLFSQMKNFKSFQNILMADRQRYNFSSRSFSWTTIIWILSHQKSESIISIRMCSQWEKYYFKSKCWINLQICKYLGHWRPKSLTIVDDIALSQVYLASSPKSPCKILNLSN